MTILQTAFLKRVVVTFYFSFLISFLKNRVAHFLFSFSEKEKFTADIITFKKEVFQKVTCNFLFSKIPNVFEKVELSGFLFQNNKMKIIRLTHALSKTRIFK